MGESLQQGSGLAEVSVPPGQAARPLPPLPCSGLMAHGGLRAAWVGGPTTHCPWGPAGFQVLPPEGDTGRTLPCGPWRRKSPGPASGMTMRWDDNNGNEV